MPSATRTPPRGDVPRRPDGAQSPSPGTIREIYRRLKKAFGPLDPPRWQDPLDELVFTVLSQNTSDVNSGRAFEAMRARYPSWEAVAEVDAGELATVIRQGGLANIKAPRILAILREIAARQRGSLDLSWMRTAGTPKVRRYLRSLPGVGPKTAACVLAFALNRPVLPVDTHVFRVARRLGFLGRGTDAAAAHDVMEEMVPARLRVGMHVGMIRLGRQICRAGRPSCEICPVQDLCPTAPTILADDRRGGRRAGRMDRMRGGILSG